jgi:hypothetical protein
LLVRMYPSTQRGDQQLFVLLLSVSQDRMMS